MTAGLTSVQRWIAPSTCPSRCLSLQGLATVLVLLFAIALPVSAHATQSAASFEKFIQKRLKAEEELVPEKHVLLRNLSPYLLVPKAETEKQQALWEKYFSALLINQSCTPRGIFAVAEAARDANVPHKFVRRAYEQMVSTHGIGKDHLKQMQRERSGLDKEIQTKEKRGVPQDNAELQYMKEHTVRLGNIIADLGLAIRVNEGMFNGEYVESTPCDEDGIVRARRNIQPKWVSAAMRLFYDLGTNIFTELVVGSLRIPNH